MDRAKKHDAPIELDARGAPVLLQLSKHVGILERMRDFRADALESQRETQGVLGHYASEKAALNVALAGLAYHRAMVQRLPEPVGMLRELVAAATTGTDGKLREVVKRAQLLLEEYPVNDGAGG